MILEVIKKRYFEEYLKNTLGILEFRYVYESNDMYIIYSLNERRNRKFIIKGTDAVSENAFFVWNYKYFTCIECEYNDDKPKMDFKNMDTPSTSIPIAQEFNVQNWFNESLSKIKILKPERGGKFLIPKSILPEDKKKWKEIVTAKYELGFISLSIKENGLLAEL